MNTRVVPVDPLLPNLDAIEEATRLLRGGGLVAFPTETVYGLGANALDDRAVAAIFAVKGRPPTNPLIVHVSDIAAAAELVAEFPEPARRLAARYWPGPLTLVMVKTGRVPDGVTAGGPTVALRVPAHPVALALLRVGRMPLAAPSANPSTALSPTTAEHVRRGLAGKIPLILDAGPTPGGLESTVLDVTVAPPRLLRPGLLSPADLAAVIGPIDATPVVTEATRPARAPGSHARHYAPTTPLELTADVVGLVNRCLDRGSRVGLLTWRPAAARHNLVVEQLPADPVGYAAGMYAALHRLDAAGLERIIVEAPPPDDAWLAVRDRLMRASAPSASVGEVPAG
ncbi:MAG: L-threonylcarbamoyladenylate synthase [Gemmataceae bacterium]|nr:L-threonylcarbamoyladenylate synthase [Gemmataceae bacterium]